MSKPIVPKAHGIGASDIRTVVGKNPEKTRYELYLQKLGLIEKDESTDAMEAGNRGEWILNELFKKDFLPDFEAQGYEYTYQPGLTRSSKHDGLVCKPDGILIHRVTGRKIIVEFKTVQDMTGIECQGVAPDHWIYQAYAMMECCEAEETYFFVFSKIDLEIIPLPPFPANKEFQNKLGKAAAKFWKMIVDNTPPDNEPVVHEELPKIELFKEVVALDYSAPETINLEAKAKELMEARKQKTLITKKVDELSKEILNATVNKGGKIMYMRELKISLIHNSGQTRCDYETLLGAYPRLKTIIDKYLVKTPYIWARVDVIK